MKYREATISRKTNETDIAISINLDGNGKYEINTGIGFLDHMLELFSKHSLVDLKVKATGDLRIDEHHLVEDIGITLGQTLKEALGEKKGIGRYGAMLLPMDEALVECAVDLGGRPYLVWNVVFPGAKVGEMSTELFEDFFKALSDNLSANIHVNLKYGRNTHHIAEGIFKAFARAIKSAVSIQKGFENVLPTTKGLI